ncbi:hypothetical protein [Pedobacter sp. GR22-6]|uniref:hypothetical protein n=1 Tax=Pedobacter sp. GR22-6 TaxID=3127957 RepID=UPI00307E3B65
MEEGNQEQALTPAEKEILEYQCKKEEKLLNLLVRIIVRNTLSELYGKESD